MPEANTTTATTPPGEDPKKIKGNSAPAPAAINVSDLKILLGEIRQKTIVRFTLAPSKKRKRFGSAIDDIVEAGQILSPSARVLEIELRALAEEEMAAADELRGSIIPPRKEAPPGAPAGTLGEFDYENKVYNAELAKADFQRTAFLIEKSVSGFQIEGADLAAKAEFLKKNFPRRLINFMVEQIEAVSSNDIRALDLATFSSSAG